MEWFVSEVDVVRVAKAGTWKVVTNKGRRYVNAKINGRWVGLQRFVTLCPRDKFVGFADGDSLNCRRENLVVGSRSVVQWVYPFWLRRNGVGVKPSSPLCRRGPFRAVGRVPDGPLIEIGYAESFEGAAEIYRAWAWGQCDAVRLQYGLASLDRVAFE